MSACGVSQHKMGHSKGVLKLSGKPSERKLEKKRELKQEQFMSFNLHKAEYHFTIFII